MDIAKLCTSIHYALVRTIPRGVMPTALRSSIRVRTAQRREYCLVNLRTNTYLEVLREEKSFHVDCILYQAE